MPERLFGAYLSTLTAEGDTSAALRVAEEIGKMVAKMHDAQVTSGVESENVSSSTHAAPAYVEKSSVSGVLFLPRMAHLFWANERRQSLARRGCFCFAPVAAGGDAKLVSSIGAISVVVS